MFNAWSQDFLQEGDSDLFTCFLEEAAWRRLHDTMPDAKRIFAYIRNGERVHACALGQPVRGGLGEDALYLPPWVLQSLQLEGAGDAINVDWITEDFAPEATKLVLRPHESAFYQANARDELEPVLTRYGILQAGMTIPVPVEALGGYVVSFDVVRCEPADLVLLEGDEVEIEFEKALDDVGVPAEPTAQMDGVMIPTPSAPAPEPEPQGNLLGGTVRPRLPDGRAWNPWRA